MGTEEAKQEYEKRSSVEGPFGTLKEEYLIEKHYVIGVKETEELITLNTAEYNIKRLYNIQQEIKNRKTRLNRFLPIHISPKPIRTQHNNFIK